MLTEHSADSLYHLLGEERTYTKELHSAKIVSDKTNNESE